MVRSMRMLSAIMFGFSGVVTAMAQNHQSNSATVNASPYLLVGGAIVVVAVGAAVAFAIAKGKSKG